jgi:hypothetical protein
MKLTDWESLLVDRCVDSISEQACKQHTRSVGSICVNLRFTRESTKEKWLVQELLI